MPYGPCTLAPPGVISFEVVNTNINSGVVLVGSELWIYLLNPKYKGEG